MLSLKAQLERNNVDPLWTGGKQRTTDMQNLRERGGGGPHCKRA